MLGEGNIHANFSVDDLEAAKKFYVDKIGLKVVKELEKLKTVVLEAGGGTMVNIYEKEDHTPWESTVMGVIVDDVRQAVEQLAGQGVNVEVLPMTDENGIASDPEMGEAAWFRDPAGNWICVSSMNF